MHIAIIFDMLPWPTTTGAHTRIASLITSLRNEGMRVTLITTSSNPSQLVERNLRFIDGIEIFHQRDFYNFLRGIKARVDLRLENWRLPTLDSFLMKLFRRRINNYWLRYPDGLDRFVLQLHREQQFDAFIVEYIWMHKSVSLVRKNTPVVVDMIDLMHKRVKEFEKSGAHPTLVITESEELRILDEFDAAIAIQESEAQAVEGKLVNCTILRTGLDSYDPIPLPDIDSPINILYIGGDNDCNVDGINWFIEMVWPEISRIHQEATLTIAGRVGKWVNIKDITSQNRVKLLGFVDDPKELYAAASICINPINFGSGLKIKTVEAIGKGRPLVTTSTGVEGMRPDPREACLVVDGKDEWIKTLHALCSNQELRYKYASSAEEYARTWLTQKFVYQEVVDWLKSFRRHRLS